MKTLHFRLAAAFAIALTALPATPVVAFELFGIHLFGQRKIPTNGYELTLNVDAAPKSVLRTIRNASVLWADRYESLGDTDSLLAIANADYRAILSALYANGYYSPQISILINGREAGTLPFDADIPLPAQIAIAVNPGPEFTFGSATIGPLAPEAQRRNDRVDPPASSGFAQGAPAFAGSIGSAADLAIEAWRQQGHPLARLADRQIVADHATAQMDVNLNIAPGPTATFGPVAVSGQTRTKADFLAFMTRFPDGRAFDPDDITRLRARLLRLGVFRSVRITEGDALNDQGQLPLTIALEELPLRRVGFGATLSSLDGVGLEAFWFHRNLFGHAERLRFDASISGLGPQSGFDVADYSLGAHFTRPGIFLPDLNFEMDFRASRESTPGFVTRAAEYQIGVQYINGPHAAQAMAFAAYSDLTDDNIFKQYEMVGLHLGATYDGRDNPLDAHRGLYLDLKISPLWEFQSAQAGVSALAEARGYLPLGAEERFVLAGRARIGSLIGFDLADAPANLLYLSGGGSSVRGYGYNTRGLGTGDDLTGGLSLINLSAEARWSINDTFGLVAFADAGLVGSTALPGETGDWHTGIGLGLRYQTGLGPLRLDIARGLNRQAGDPGIGIYIGLGQSF